MFPDKVEWLLDCKPRAVQQEALLRSFYGFKSRDHKDEEPNPVLIRTGFAEGHAHFLEMRLGKTPTALNEFALFKVHHGICRAIIFSPNSYKDDWVNEAAKFGLDVPFFAHETTKSKLTMKFLDDNKSAFGLVVNYESLRYDSTKEILSEIINKDAMLIADESIKLKNPQTETTKEALAYAKEAGIVRELTGCPMTQGPHDMFSQLRFIGALNGQNFFGFRNKFCKMGGFKNKQVKGPKNEEELNAIINQHGFVAKRRDWGTPSVPEHYTVKFSLDPVQQKHYDEMDDDFITFLGRGEEDFVSADQVISKLMKLQQISSGFVYMPDGGVRDLMPIKDTAKMKRLVELMEETSGKVIVPYHYGKSGDALMEVLDEYNPAVIRGGLWMKQNKRDVVAEKLKFNKDPDCRVIILQISAGKYGHDLSGIPGNRCGTMIFYENTYSLDDRIQIEMRNTAAEQDWGNVYLDLVASPVEMNAINALAKKESIVTAVLGAYNLNKERKTVS